MPTNTVGKILATKMSSHVSSPQTPKLLNAYSLPLLRRLFVDLVEKNDSLGIDLLLRSLVPTLMQQSSTTAHNNYYSTLREHSSLGLNTCTSECEKPHNAAGFFSSHFPPSNSSSPFSLPDDPFVWSTIWNIVFTTRFPRVAADPAEDGEEDTEEAVRGSEREKKISNEERRIELEQSILGDDVMNNNNNNNNARNTGEQTTQTTPCDTNVQTIPSYDKRNKEDKARSSPCTVADSYLESNTASSCAGNLSRLEKASHAFSPLLPSSPLPILHHTEDWSIKERINTAIINFVDTINTIHDGQQQQQQQQQRRDSEGSRPPYPLHAPQNPYPHSPHLVDGGNGSVGNVHYPSSASSARSFSRRYLKFPSPYHVTNGDDKASTNTTNSSGFGVGGGYTHSHPYTFLDIAVMNSSIEVAEVVRKILEEIEQLAEGSSKKQEDVPPQRAAGSDSITCPCVHADEHDNHACNHHASNYDDENKLLHYCKSSVGGGDVVTPHPHGDNVRIVEHTSANKPFFHVAVKKLSEADGDEQDNKQDNVTTRAEEKEEEGENKKQIDLKTFSVPHSNQHSRCDHQYHHHHKGKEVPRRGIAPSCHEPPATFKYWVRLHCVECRALLDTVNAITCEKPLARYEREEDDLPLAPRSRPRHCIDRPPTASSAFSSPPLLSRLRPPPLQLLALQSNTSEGLIWVLDHSSMMVSGESDEEKKKNKGTLTDRNTSSFSFSSSSIIDLPVDSEGQTLLHVAVSGIVAHQKNNLKKHTKGGGRGKRKQGENEMKIKGNEPPLSDTLFGVVPTANTESSFTTQQSDAPPPLPPNFFSSSVSSTRCGGPSSFTSVFIRTPLIKMLLARGADVNAADFKGRTPMYTLISGLISFYGGAMGTAVLDGVDAAGINKNTSECGSGPIGDRSFSAGYSPGNMYRSPTTETAATMFVTGPTGSGTASSGSLLFPRTYTDVTFNTSPTTYFATAHRSVAPFGGLSALQEAHLLDERTFTSRRDEDIFNFFRAEAARVVPSPLGRLCRLTLRPFFTSDASFFSFIRSSSTHDNNDNKITKTTLSKDQRGSHGDGSRASSSEDDHSGDDDQYEREYGDGGFHDGGVPLTFSSAHLSRAPAILRSLLDYGATLFSELFGASTHEDSHSSTLSPHSICSPSLSVQGSTVARPSFLSASVRVLPPAIYALLMEMDLAIDHAMDLFDLTATNARESLGLGLARRLVNSEAFSTFNSENTASTAAKSEHLSFASIWREIRRTGEMSVVRNYPNSLRLLTDCDLQHQHIAKVAASLFVSREVAGGPENNVRNTVNNTDAANKVKNQLQPRGLETDPSRLRSAERQRMRQAITLFQTKLARRQAQAQAQQQAQRDSEGTQSQQQPLTGAEQSPRSLASLLPPQQNVAASDQTGASLSHEDNLSVVASPPRGLILCNDRGAADAATVQQQQQQQRQHREQIHRVDTDSSPTRRSSSTANTTSTTPPSASSVTVSSPTDSSSLSVTARATSSDTTNCSKAVQLHFTEKRDRESKRKVKGERKDAMQNRETKAKTKREKKSREGEGK